MALTKIGIAREWDRAWGPLVDSQRGLAQRAMIAYRIAVETGGDVLAVSKDPRLIEVGWSQIPLARAWRWGADPFDARTAVWLACRMEHEAAAHWLAAYPELRVRPRDVAYVAALEYSVGRKAVGHLLDLADECGPPDATVEGRVLWVADHVDLSRRNHLGYWGRQDPGVIRKRCHKKAAWCDACTALGPLDQPEGQDPMESLPPACLPFPAALVRDARIVADPDTDDDRVISAEESAACKAAREHVHAYTRLQRRLTRERKAPVLYRITRALGL